MADRFDPQQDPEAYELAVERARRVSPPQRFVGMSAGDALRARLAADPTSILLDDEDIAELADAYRPTTAMVTFSRNVTWTPAMTLPAVPQQAWVVVDAAGIWKELSAAADRVVRAAEEEALNRRRHGAASWCPRHGPTRGGLCRKCAR